MRIAFNSLQTKFLAGNLWCVTLSAHQDSCRCMGGDDTLWREPIHAHANIDADTPNPYLVPCFKPVSTQAFAIYWMDPHVVVFCPSAVGCGVVGFSSKGAGPDIYSCASRVRLVVLDTPGDRDRGMERIWGFSQQ